MALAPFLLAAFFGLLISALLYFVLVWPAREPGDEDDLDHPGEAVTGHLDGKAGPGAGAAAGGDPA